MKPCQCGRSLYRHGNAVIKRTGELKRMFRCKGCGARESYYSKDGGATWARESRKAGSPIND